MHGIDVEQMRERAREIRESITKHKAPSSYAECFEGLESLGILDRSLTERLTRMARFRNLLIHRYWQIDPQRVLLYARENLGDLEEFLTGMGRWLGQESGLIQEGTA
jgi:uncharacterized protein YutE (UPF0331/DUF86 family)